MPTVYCYYMIFVLYLKLELSMFLILFKLVLVKFSQFISTFLKHFHLQS